MSQNKSIFYDEWRACLKEHYLHVVRIGDSITEPSLREVLLDMGFAEEEIQAIQEEGNEESPS